MQSFSKVIKLDPYSLDGYIGRGNSYLEYGHVEGTVKALKDFLRALHLNPISIKARLCLGYNLQVTQLRLYYLVEKKVGVNLTIFCGIVSRSGSFIVLRTFKLFSWGLNYMHI